MEKITIKAYNAALDGDLEALKKLLETVGEDDVVEIQAEDDDHTIADPGAVLEVHKRVGTSGLK